MEQLSDIRRLARRNAVPIMRDEGSDFICRYIAEHGCARVLELGTAIGYSAIKFAQAADGVFVTTVEIDAARQQEAARNFKDSGLAPRIHSVLADALSYEPDGLFDLIFIDGPKGQYIRLFEKYKKFLASGGAIISDNLFFHGMVEDLTLTHNKSTKRLVRQLKKYIYFLKTNTEFSTEFCAVGDGISVSRRKTESE